MTPEDAVGIESGEEKNPLSPLLEKHGVTSIDELDKKIESLNVPNRAFAEMRNEMKGIKEELEAKDRELQEKQDGLGDGDEGAIVRELRSLKRDFAEIQKQVLVKPEDKELQPFIEIAMDKKPWIKRLPTAAERMDAARTVAIGLRAEIEADERESAALKTGRRKADTISRTYVERSGGTSHGSGGTSSEDEDLKRYDKELEEAGVDAKAVIKIEAKYRARYPHWGI